MDIYNLDNGKLQEIANWTKNMLISRLEKDGLLQGKSGTEISREYQLVVVKKGWFGNLVDKLFGFDKPDAVKSLQFVVMKIPPDMFEEKED